MKKKLNLTTWDGNIFSVIGNTTKYLREAKVDKKTIDKTTEKAMSSHSYHEALGVCMGALEKAGYTV